MRFFWRKRQRQVMRAFRYSQKTVVPHLPILLATYVIAIALIGPDALTILRDLGTLVLYGLRFTSTIVALNLWSYWSHRIDHDLFQSHTHTVLHHSDDDDHTPSARLNSFLIDVCFYGGGWTLLLPHAVVDRRIALLFALTYAGAHLFTYHIAEIGDSACFHAQHHCDTGTNYGPSWMDHLFGTYSPACTENTTWLIPVMSGAAVIVSCATHLLPSLLDVGVGDP